MSKEQAERVQKLEKENKLLRFIAEENKIAYEQRVEQNRRYREAFEKIVGIKTPKGHCTYHYHLGY